MRLSHLPLRVAAGAYLVTSGLNRWQAPSDAAADVQKQVRVAFPQVPDVPPGAFGKGLAAGELALGAALLSPFVSPVVAGAALAAFSGAMLKVWWVTPGTHEPGSARPTPEGMPQAKDLCLLGAGVSLALDGVGDGARRSARRTRKAARRAKKSAAKKAHEVREALPVG
jgi:uncharacterized membrane protein YphA (DoxX/SURF4 family)